ncbi:MAG: hypothetical protein U0936_25555 [Planctomycetaceae bacterium]
MLVDAAAEKFIADFREDPRSRSSLHFLTLEAEQTKTLTCPVRPRAAVTVQHEGHHKTYQIEQTEFETHSRKLIQRSEEITRRFLKDSKFGWAHIDVVLTTGGISDTNDQGKPQEAKSPNPEFIAFTRPVNRLWRGVLCCDAFTASVMNDWVNGENSCNSSLHDSEQSIMNEFPRTKLIEVIKSLRLTSERLSTDPKLIKGLLLDLCGQHREINVLVLALAEGICGEVS